MLSDTLYQVNRNQQADFQTAEEPLEAMRPQYRNSLHLFSPQHSNVMPPPRHPTEATLKPSSEMYYPTSSLTSSNAVGKSALADFADENISSAGYQQRQSQGRPRSRIEKKGSASSFVGARSGSAMSKDDRMSSQQRILKVRSSSAIIGGADVTSSATGKQHKSVVYTESSAQEASDYNRQSSNVLETIQAREKRRLARVQKKARSLANENKKATKRKHRREKEHGSRSRSRSRKNAETVVVQRYPPLSNTNQSFSYEQTLSSIEPVEEKAGRSRLDQHRSYKQGSRSIHIGAAGRSSQEAAAVSGNNFQKVIYRQATEFENEPPISRSDSAEQGDNRSDFAAARDNNNNVRHRQNRSRQSCDRSRGSKKRRRSSQERKKAHEEEQLWKKSLKQHSLLDQKTSPEQRMRTSQEEQRRGSCSKERKKVQRQQPAGSGITPYQPSSRDELTTSGGPLTSSQLEDDYGYGGCTDKSQVKKVNEPFLYYQRLVARQQQATDLSSRPQEVVLATVPPMSGDSCQQQQLVDKVDERDDLFSMVPNNHKQQPSLGSASLRDYHKIASQKEQVLAQRMNELKQIKQEISSINNFSSISQPKLIDQSVQQQVWQQTMSSSAMEFDQQQSLPDRVQSSSVLILDDQRPPKSSSQESIKVDSSRRPRSQIGQNYLRHLERNKPSAEPLQQFSSVEESNESRKYEHLVTNPRPTLHPQVVQRNLTPPPIPMKKIADPKQYCIGKLIGRLDTRKSMARVSPDYDLVPADRKHQRPELPTFESVGSSKQQQQQNNLEMTHGSGQYILTTQPSPIKDLNVFESKSSFIERLGRFNKREGQRHGDYASHDSSKYSRSQSQLDLQAQERYRQSRSELFKSENTVSTFTAASRQRSTEEIKQRSTAAYYTLGEQLQSMQDKKSSVEALGQQNYHQDSNKVLGFNDDFKQVMSRYNIQGLLDKADDVIRRSAGRLDSARGSVQPQTNNIVDVVEESPQMLIAKGKYSATDFYGHRIAELQRQTLEIQEAPIFYNDRVASLKSRTNELCDLAREYASGEKDDRPLSNNGLSQRQNQRRLPSADEDGNSSFVKQHDVTSSFLRKEQLDHRLEMEPSVENGIELQSIYAASLGHDRPPPYLQQNARLGQQRDRSQVYSQQITLQKPDDIMRHQNKVFSMGENICSSTTYRSKSYKTPGQTELNGLPSVPSCTEGTSEQLYKAQRRQRRHEKRDRKLKQLKDLHERAQQSMTKIASELTSNGSFYPKSLRQNLNGVMQQHHQQSQVHFEGQQSSAVSQDNEPINASNDEKDTTRSRVEILTAIRKEIRRLIKIQNKHGKVLTQLQKAGVIAQNSSNPIDSQYTSMSEMNDESHHEQYQQQAMSNTLLNQIQQIFQQLADVQAKLDYEIGERRLRTGQMRDQSITTETFTNGTTYEPPSQVQHQSNRASNHAYSNYHQHATSNGSYRDNDIDIASGHGMPPHQHTNASLRNKQLLPDQEKQHQLSQGTQSTLFWETQMAAGHQAYGSNQVSKDYQNQQQQQQHQIEEEEQYDENAAADDYHLDLGPKDGKGMLVMPSTPLSAPEGTQVTETDEADPFMYNQMASGMNTISASEQLNLMMKLPNSCKSGTQSTHNVINGIRVEQLCDILSKEISRVREESVQQAQHMHATYENELQALRQEFFSCQNGGSNVFNNGSAEQQQSRRVSTRLSAVDDAAMQNTQRMEQMLMLRQSERSRIGSDGCTPRTHTVSDRILSMRTASQAGLGVSYHDRVSSAQMLISQPSSSAMEVQIVPDAPRLEGSQPESVFEELEKVKAERDLFYDKIMMLKARLDKGQSYRQNDSSCDGFQSSSLRNGVAKNIYYQLEDPVSEQPPAAESSNSKRRSIGLLPANVATVRNVQSVGELLAPDTTTATFSHDFVDIPNRNKAVVISSTQFTNRISSPQMLKPPSFQHEPSKQSIQQMMLLAGEKQQNCPVANQKPPINKRNDSSVRQSTESIPVRQNRTSILRQNKILNEKETQEQKSLSGGLSNNGDFERTGVSGQSRTSVTCKHPQAPHAIQLQAYQQRGSSRGSSSRHQSNKIPKPFMNGLATEMQTMDNRNKTAQNRILISDAPPYPRNFPVAKEQYPTFSAAKTPIALSSTNNSLEKMLHKAQQQQTPTSSSQARSPRLIQRMAVQHKMFVNKMQMEDQTGRRPTDQFSSNLQASGESKALSVINHYLQKYGETRSTSAATH